MLHRERIKKIINSNPKLVHPILFAFNYLCISNRLLIGMKNKFIFGNSILVGVKLKVYGSGNEIVLGELCNLRKCSIRIYGDNNKINIGNNVFMNSVKLHIEDNNNEINIGKNSSFHNNVEISAIESTKVIIGDDCMFASEIDIRSGDSHSIIDETNRRLNYSEDIHIGNHVWIGVNVICLKGVKVPDGCIVGAGTTLTRKYKDENCIIVGNPGNIVKRNVNWLRDRI